MKVEITPTRTYATRENAEKAVACKLHPSRTEKVTWFVATHTDGRFYPLFVGERAVQEGVHFHFNVVM